jgi:hypothetical protein
MSVTLTRNGTPLVPQTIVNVKPNDWFPIELTVQGSLVALKFAGGGTGATRLEPPLAAGPIVLELVDGNSVLEFRKIEIMALKSLEPE